MSRGHTSPVDELASVIAETQARVAGLERTTHLHIGGTGGGGGGEVVTAGAGLTKTGTTIDVVGDSTMSVTADQLGVINDGITNLKLANMPTLTLKGNNTGATADPKDLTVAEVNAMLGLSAGGDEVWVGPLDPGTGVGYEMWYDSDAVSPLANDARWNTAWGVVGVTPLITVDQTGIGLTLTNLTGYAMPFTAVANRVYRVTWLFAAAQIGGAGNQTFRLLDGGVSLGDIETQNSLISVQNSLRTIGGGRELTDLAAGAHNLTIAGVCSTGTISIYNATINGRMAVIDIGPVAGVIPSIPGGNMYGLEAIRPAVSTVVPGSHFYATDTFREWLSDGTRWVQVAGVMPRFRLIGGGSGQSLPSGWNNCTWATGTPTDPMALTSGGVFTCPASHPGRWRFDYTIDIQAWNAGFRQATLQAQPGSVNFAYQSTTAVSATIANYFTGSAEYVLTAGQTVRAMAYQDAGTLAANSNALSYFQGQFVGPV